MSIIQKPTSQIRISAFVRNPPMILKKSEFVLKEPILITCGGGAEIKRSILMRQQVGQGKVAYLYCKSTESRWGKRIELHPRDINAFFFACFWTKTCCTKSITVSLTIYRMEFSKGLRQGCQTHFNFRRVRPKKNNPLPNYHFDDQLKKINKLTILYIKIHTKVLQFTNNPSI